MALQSRRSRKRRRRIDCALGKSENRECVKAQSKIELTNNNIVDTSLISIEKNDRCAKRESPEIEIIDNQSSECVVIPHLTTLVPSSFISEEGYKLDSTQSKRIATVCNVAEENIEWPMKKKARFHLSEFDNERLKLTRKCAILDETQKNLKSQDLNNKKDISHDEMIKDYKSTLSNYVCRTFAKYSPAEIEEFDRDLAEYYRNNVQTQAIFEKKLAVRDALYDIAKMSIDCKSLFIVGSTVTGCAPYNSDLDLCCVLNKSTAIISKRKQNIIKCLILLQKSIQRNKNFNKNFHVLSSIIIRARVPILTMTIRIDDDFILEVDININEKFGIVNSRMFAVINQLDHRFAKLALIIKHWGIATKAIDSVNCRMSTYSTLLMLVHYLQFVDNPVLPPFDTFYDHDVFNSNAMEYKSKNGDSLLKLLIGFFAYYGSVIDYERFGISVRNGLVMRDVQNVSQPSMSGNEKQMLVIEDPFHLKNCVKAKDFEDILQKFKNAHTKLYSKISFAEFIDHCSC